VEFIFYRVELCVAKFLLSYDLSILVVI
jgi:hypothetical protein